MPLLLRTALALSLSVGLAFAAGGCLVAADDATTASTAAASAAKPVNTICPKEGDPVDPKIAPVTVTTKDGKTVCIGVCCADCPGAIAKDPDKYAAAALKNEKAK